MEKANLKKEYLLLLLGSGIMAVLCGGVGALFSYALKLANSCFYKYNWLLLLLPLGGFLTVGLYKSMKLTGKSIHTVFSAVENGENAPFLLAPAVFFGTALTQLFGGSAGKEGAALQIGGGIASPVARLLGLKNDNLKILLLCGMTSVFAAVFTTPLTALAFGLEIIFISRKFYLKAFLPLTDASLGGYGIAQLLGVHPERFSINELPKFGTGVFFKNVLLILICSAVCIAFCLAIEWASLLFKRVFKNEYLRIAVGGVLIIALTFIVGNGDYNGGGMRVIENVLHTGSAAYFAFALKILFTAVTNAAGFKGGEIVPALFIGATLGAAVGNLLGLPPVFSAAVGMISLFSGATKCMVAATMLGIEFFGIDGIGYFAASAVIARVVTAKIGLYTHKED